MSQPPRLFDRATLLAHRNRARRGPDGPALFLHQAVADEIEQRLEEVNRTFTKAAVITGFPEIWQKRPRTRLIPDDETLGLSVTAHDLLLHVLSLHWANDPVGQLVQCRQAMAPDGLLIAALFGGQTLQELRAALTEAEADITGGLSPRVAPMGELRDLGGLLQRAGFALPVADYMPLTVTYETPFHLMRDLRAMGETNAMSDRLRYPTRRGVFAQAARIYAERHATPDGRIPATFEIAFLTGWAPADSQPKPLRPGSAQTRLADALGTKEFREDWSND